jgi:hypothetical protein
MNNPTGKYLFFLHSFMLFFARKGTNIYTGKYLFFATLGQVIF